ncbi:MAG: hypothetical protein ACKO1U_08110, partial [Bacteroidota bacterium]
MMKRLRFLVTLLSLSCTNVFSQIYCSVQGTTFCANDTFAVTFNSYLANPGNIYSVELGYVFAGPNPQINFTGTIIGSLASDTIYNNSTGTILCTLPPMSGIPMGSAVRVRVNSSDPNSIGTDNGVDLFFNPTPSVTANQGLLPCYGGNNGIIYASTGQNGPDTTISWSWIPFVNHPSPLEQYTGIDLLAGDYLITATDTNGCSSSVSITLNEQSQISGSLTSSMPGCFGDSTGSVTVDNPTGGTPFYGFGSQQSYYKFNLYSNETLIDSNQTGFFNHLTSGAYQIEVKDANDCASNLNAFLEEPMPIVFTVTPDSQGVCISAFGEVTLNTEGGTPPYITSGDSTAGLGPGIYNYYVMDANGCSDTAVAQLTSFQCITTSIIPPPNGKQTSALGPELVYLYQVSDSITGLVEANENDTTLFELLENKVRIEVIANENKYDTLLYLLQNPYYGMTDLINNGDNNLVITGTFPIRNLPRLEAISGINSLINYVRPYLPPVNNRGIVETLGDQSMKSDSARILFNVAGEGVKVGVISDSYNKLPGNKAAINVLNGNLPGNSTNNVNP